MDRIEYESRTKGLPMAEAVHGGVKRGGYTDGKTFFYCARERRAVPVSEVRDLQILTPRLVIAETAYGQTTRLSQAVFCF